MNSFWVKRSTVCEKGQPYIYIWKYYSSNDDRIWISFLKFFNGSWSHQISSLGHYLTSRQVIILYGWRQIFLARGEIIDSRAIQIRSSWSGSLLSPLAPSLHQSRMPRGTFLVDGYRFSAPFVDVRSEIRTESEERGSAAFLPRQLITVRVRNSNTPPGLLSSSDERGPLDTIGEERVPVREARANFAATTAVPGQLSRPSILRTWLREFRSPVNIIRDTKHESRVCLCEKATSLIRRVMNRAVFLARILTFLFNF